MSAKKELLIVMLFFLSSLNRSYYMRLFFVVILFSAQLFGQKNIDRLTVDVNAVLESYHKAAADSDFNAYFDLFTSDAIFIGTDATENWNMTQFKAYAQPVFQKKRGWKMSAFERHIFFTKDGKTAWFDELLDTSMSVCRGSGVLVKVGKEWKIKHYVLSMTIPNDEVKQVLPLIVEKQAELRKEILTK